MLCHSIMVDTESVSHFRKPREAEGLRHRSSVTGTDSSIDSVSPEEDKIHSSKPSYIPWRTVECIIAPILFTAIGAYVRLYKIAESNSVVWDEAHFGKFGSQYLRHEFYFDLHPPLGKLLVGLSGYLAGYNGSFKFESGSTYPDDMAYDKMRVFNCVFSILCVPVAYATGKALDLSLWAVWLVTLLVTLENSYIALSKFILLDSMLMLFTVTTFFCLVKMHRLNRENRQFSRIWWKWLVLSGVSIGCVCSVKLVGLFVTAVYGFYTICELFSMFGDPRVSKKIYFFHWVSRIFCLIVIPLIVYMLSFKAHFTLLYNSGKGNGHMSSLFQAHLKNSDIVFGPRQVAYGSEVTIRTQGLYPGLLHSHRQTYPDGSNQQQVTIYAHKDSNNDFILEYPRISKHYSSQDQEPVFITNGDLVRLYHKNTKKSLHSHNVRAPVTTTEYEVSGYGNATFGDANDDFIVEIVEQQTAQEAPEQIHPLTTSFRLRHKMLGCYLATSGNTLPPWGFKQGEVICKRRLAFGNDKSAVWNVENHHHPHLEDPNPSDLTKLPKSKFMRDFIQLNIAMMASNNALVPDPAKNDEIASQWWQWALCRVGIRMGKWSGNNIHYFLIFSPLALWASTAFLALFAGYCLWHGMKWLRQQESVSYSKWDFFIMAGFYPFLGWILHYLPFMVMGRVTYVHHYLPALYFAYFVMGFLLDVLTGDGVFGNIATTPKRKLIKTVVFIAAYAYVLYGFKVFHGFSMGFYTKGAANDKYRWLSTWNIK